MGCRTGGMLDKLDAGHVGGRTLRTCGRQDRWDAGQVVQELQDRKDE